MEEKKSNETEKVENSTPVVEKQKVEENVVTPVTTEPKKGFQLSKKHIGIGVAVVALVVILALLIGNSGSKNVFKKTITKSYKEVVKSAKEVDKKLKNYDLSKNALYFDGNLKVNATNDGEDAGTLDVEWNAGISGKDEKAYGTAKINGKDENISVETLIEDGKTYIKSSLFDEIIDASENTSEENLKQVFNTLTETKKTNAIDVTEVGQYIINALVNNLDSDKIESESSELELGEKEVKVKKISYDLSGKSFSKLGKAIIDELLDNDKFLEKTVDLVNSYSEEDDNKISKKDLKDSLKSMKESLSDISIDEKASFNIYTKGILNKVVGYSVTYDKKDYLTIAFDNKNINVTYDDHNEDKDDRQKLTLVATKEKKEWNVVVKANKEKIATATVRELSDEKIDLDYKVTIEDEELKGSIYFTNKEKGKTINGEYKAEVEYSDAKVEVSGEYTIEVKDEVEESFDTKDTVKPEDIDTDKLEENIEKVKDDEILGTILSDKLDEIFKSVNNYNYYDMKEVEDEKVLDVLKKNKAVLYVGKTYYSIYSKEDSYNLFSYLKEAQEELGFHSYYYDEYYADDDIIKKLNEGLEMTCGINKTDIKTEEDKTEENTEEKNDETDKAEEKNDTVTTETETPSEETSTAECDELPAIYLIKDGKVVRVIRGKITYEQLTEALAEIGIN